MDHSYIVPPDKIVMNSQLHICGVKIWWGQTDGYGDDSVWLEFWNTIDEISTIWNGVIFYTCHYILSYVGMSGHHQNLPVY